MPGVFGIIGPYKKDDISNYLNKMIRVIKMQDKELVDDFIEHEIGLGRVHFGVANPEKQPIWNEDRSMCIILDGEIYDFKVKKSELEAKGHKFMFGNDPEMVLHLFEEFGTHVVRKLNGSFTLAIWDKLQKKLIIANDRYGSRPLYYSNSNSSLVFAPKIRMILECLDIDRKINHSAIADFFTFSFLLGEKTFFENIKLLPAASILQYQDSQLSINKYWDFQFDEDYESRANNNYIEEFCALMKQAVKRVVQKPGRRVFNLSGGLDTRTVLAMVDRASPIDTFTLGVRNCRDHQIAHKISHILGTRHHPYYLSADCIKKYAKQVVTLTEGMIDIYSLISFAGVLPSLQKKFEVSTGGVTGGELFGAYQISPAIYSQISNKERFVRKLFSSIRHWGMSENEKTLLFSKDYYTNIKDLAYDSFVESIKGAKYNIPFNITDYFNFTQVLRRFNIHGVMFARHWIEYQVPFYDYDLVDFALKLPPELRDGEKLRVEALMREFPELDRVPSTNPRLSLSVSPFLKFVYKKKRRVIQELDRATRLLSKDWIYLESQTFSDSNRWIRTGSRKYVKEIILSPKALNRPYFNAKYINKLVNDHIARKSNNANKIGLLLTFELWHRMFIDQEID